MDLERALSRYLELEEEDRRKLVDRILEIVLSSPNPDLVPDEVGRKISNKFRSGKLYDLDGFKLLLQAANTCEPIKLKKFLEGMI